MTTVSRICVFCGASSGANPDFRQAARQLGGELARRKIGLVYGGGRVGLMGAIADAALAEDGEVIGVIPESLAKRELAHPDLSQLIVVASMHERKRTMADLSAAFVALPGGLGTLEELFEIWTWAQLGLHQKPLGLVNVSGYFDTLQAFLDETVRETFVLEEHRNLILTDSDPVRLLERIIGHLGQPPRDEWVKRRQLS